MNLRGVWEAAWSDANPYAVQRTVTVAQRCKSGTPDGARPLSCWPDIALCLLPELLRALGRSEIDLFGATKVVALQSGFSSFFRESCPFVAGHKFLPP